MPVTGTEKRCLHIDLICAHWRAGWARAVECRVSKLTLATPCTIARGEHTVA
jgi:hypothetical protein